MASCASSALVTDPDSCTSFGLTLVPLPCRYVIDTGYVKMKVFNPKMGMDALQVRTP